MDESHVELPCPKCRVWQQLNGNATERRCEDCGAHYRFLRCSACGDIAQVGKKAGRGGSWVCPSCLSEVNVGFIRAPERGTAERIYAQLTAKGGGKNDPEFRSRGGFRVASTAGYDLPSGTVCSVGCAVHELRIVPAGELDAISIAYDSLIAADLAEGERAAGGGYEYTTFSGNGAADVGGEVLAGVLNALSGKKTTVLRVATPQSEIVLGITAKPEPLRDALARLLAHAKPDPAGPDTTEPADGA